MSSSKRALIATLIVAVAIAIPTFLPTPIAALLFGSLSTALLWGLVYLLLDFELVQR